MRPVFQVLDEEQRRRIAETAFDLLEQAGVRLTEPAARELLHSAGARCAGDRVHIPPALVERAIESAPASITIYDRAGNAAMLLEGRNIYFGAHTDAPEVLDPATGRRRPCLGHDVARHAALIGALPNISFATASGLVADCPPELADRAAAAACFTNISKPVLVMPLSLEALHAIRAMAAVSVGGEAALQARPNLVVYAEPVSPLAHPDESMRKLLYCAGHLVPVAYVPFAARGGTAPVSHAAIVAQLCAESLSALAVHQLRQPGAPFIFGGMASVMDMRTTLFSYGAPEFQLGNTMMAEMAHHFNLPNFGTAGTSDAQCFDGQAVLEASTSCLLAALSGAHLIHDVGLLGSATVVMPEMIVATDEIIGMLAHLLDPVPVDEDALSLDLFSEAQDKGEFLTHPYTIAHHRELWYPRLLYRGGDKRWTGAQATTFEARVKARTRQLLETYSPQRLEPEAATEIARIAGWSPDAGPVDRARRSG